MVDLLHHTRQCYISNIALVLDLRDDVFVEVVEIFFSQAVI